MEIKWQEEGLDHVLNYFARDYKSPKFSVIKHEAYVDRACGKVIFKLYVLPKYHAQERTSPGSLGSESGSQQASSEPPAHPES